MADVKVNRLTNANVYVNGVSMLGRAEEINLPGIKAKMSEHKALGLIAANEYFSGFEKLEAKIKWNSFYEDALKASANFVATSKLQVRASLEVYESAGRTAQKAVVAFITGQFKSFPEAGFKQNDNVEASSDLAVTHYRLEIDGVEIVEIDTIASIYRVDGVDLLAEYRDNLGI